jgi:hypothetical protein
MRPSLQVTTRAWKSPFLRIYFVLQSYLQQLSNTPFHVRRQRRVLGLYAGLVTTLTIASHAAPAAFVRLCSA